MTPFKITDEAFFLMTWAKSPGIKLLATAPMAPTQSAGTHAGEVVPQAWTYERTFFPGLGGQPPFRAFVWMQGHNYANLQPTCCRCCCGALRGRPRRRSTRW